MTLVILDEVAEFVDKLSPDNSAKILAGLRFLELNRTEVLSIKPLKHKIMELVIKQYRVIFFRFDAKIYVVEIFKKQSQKTPQRIIERAERIHRNIGGLKILN